MPHGKLGCKLRRIKQLATCLTDESAAGIRLPDPGTLLMGYDFSFGHSFSGLPIPLDVILF